MHGIVGVADAFGIGANGAAAERSTRQRLSVLIDVDLVLLVGAIVHLVGYLQRIHLDQRLGRFGDEAELLETFD